MRRSSTKRANDRRYKREGIKQSKGGCCHEADRDHPSTPSSYVWNLLLLDSRRESLAKHGLHQPHHCSIAHRVERKGKRERVEIWPAMMIHCTWVTLLLRRLFLNSIDRTGPQIIPQMLIPPFP